MEKLIGLLILTLSLLATGNATLIYKRSFYLESPGRVNLEAIVDNVDQLDKERLISLSRRLASISDSDFQILLIMSEQFRKTILNLMICLISGLLFILYLQLKPYLKSG